MTPPILRFEVKPLLIHTQVYVYAGPDNGEHLELAGSVVLNTAEWERLKEVLEGQENVAIVQHGEEPFSQDV